jgi:iron transport multicopper oxidase
LIQCVDIRRHSLANTDVPVHCHIEWHVEAGKTITFIEAPDVLQKMNIQLPQDHLRICNVQRIPTVGNCAGITSNPFDTRQCPDEQFAVNVGAIAGAPN